MATVIELNKQLVRANGVDLYCELSGSGAPVLFIAGGSGDSAHFDRVTAELASDFTIITYDRRASARSPRPEGWTATPIPVEADDAAALTEALGVAPVAVFGTSLGANIAIELLVRHPDVVRGSGGARAVVRPDHRGVLPGPRPG